MRNTHNTRRGRKQTTRSLQMHPKVYCNAAEVRIETTTPSPDSKVRHVMRVPISSISIGANGRECDPADIEALAESMGRIGLINPPEVRPVAGHDPANLEINRPMVLISGQHRLEAAKLLGWNEIDCLIFDGSDLDARLRQISENLHQFDRPMLERDELLAEWVRLTNEGGQNDQPLQGGAQPHDKGISKAARALPVRGKTPEARRKNIERALKVSRMAEEAKDIVRAAELENNRTVLLAIAKEPTAEAQIQTAQKLAARNDKRGPRASSPAMVPAAPVAPMEQVESGVSSETELVTSSDRRDTAEVLPEDVSRYPLLYDAWNAAIAFRTAWASASTDARVRFVDEVLWGEAA
jgi:ParB-like chromosome segregation protein Spo0J